MHGDAVGSVVVVDDEKPLGLVSDRDLAMAVLDETFDAEETDIVEFVDEETPTIEGDAGVYDLVELLSQKGLRRVPVVEDGELAGIISLSDVVVLLGMELQHVGTAIRSSSPAYERSGMEYYHD
ncbi:cyclic nucleotide-binding/CBS domain-containing protein [Halovenus salina]|uniref:Cyclic nucleotide-binding/CBS domain-containing protein n=2 Tax=Halovenus salina TaxID=1510225 RepID=A0ABD5VW34_9EURY